ncbi:hypothetical protein CEQ21_07345 (plasmid) [Niallia circulans]|uniref:Uncharacterized protein n=1 Tax=Niallia circulans TaxID=1397 RepID=A0A553SQV2_NIACI|nr:hypothetical protein [Niallia circulans]TRZ39368.1 hypothetical protein CEQ21_07345 [Niallia circulans]
MLRDIPYTLWLMIAGIILIVVTGMYYQTNYKQDSVVMGLTETVRTSAINNADNSSRINPGELYISKDGFEEDFKKRMAANKNVKISETATYEFKYLDNENGATKAIKVLIKDDVNTYQATAKVSVSES